MAKVCSIIRFLPYFWKLNARCGYSLYRTYSDNEQLNKKASIIRGCASGSVTAGSFSNVSVLKKVWT